MKNRFASPLSLVVAAILGGLVSQGISRWMPEAQAQDSGDKFIKSLRAEDITIVDKKGNARTWLSVDEDGSSTIALFGAPLPENGKRDGLPSSLILSATPSEATLALFRKGKMKGLFQCVENHTQLSIYGSASRTTLVGLDVLEDVGISTVLISDGKDKGATAVMAITKANGPLMFLREKESKFLWRAP